MSASQQAARGAPCRPLSIGDQVLVIDARLERARLWRIDGNRCTVMQQGRLRRVDGDSLIRVDHEGVTP